MRSRDDGFPGALPGSTYVPSNQAMFGMPIENPEVLSPVQESIFNSLLLTGTSLMAGIYLIRVLPREKNAGWQLLGWFGLTGAWFGTLKGITSILYHFLPPERKN